MNVMGIIAEYNPFHNGHYYHLHTSKRELNPDITVAVISSSFTQRGEPAVIDKWYRTQMALESGIDLIIELPFPFACSSAQHFARGGIAILNILGCNYISFGAEHSDLSDLQNISRQLIAETDEYSRIINQHLKKGFSYPKARVETCKKILPPITGLSPQQVGHIMSSPNNILALEYLNAINSSGAEITPFPVQRLGPGYHDTHVDKNLASATAIRELLKEGKEEISALAKVMPEKAFSIFAEGIQKGAGPILASSLAQIILARLRCSDPEELAYLPDMEPGLENRLISCSKRAISYEDFLQKIQTKRFVRTRLQRTLIYLLTGLTEKARRVMNFYNCPTHIRPLGFNLQGKKLLNKFKEDPPIPLITRIAHRKIPRSNEALHTALKYEVRASELLAVLTPETKYRKGRRDYRQHPIVLHRN